jgi:hypothetical protein
LTQFLPYSGWCLPSCTPTNPPQTTGRKIFSAHNNPHAPNQGNAKFQFSSFDVAMLAFVGWVYHVVVFAGFIIHHLL